MTPWKTNRLWEPKKSSKLGCGSFATILENKFSVLESLRANQYFHVPFPDVCDPGWSYFNGYCYFTSETCTNWTNALQKCHGENSVLIDVNTNEENVYIQHRHNGDNSWLGLNDRSTEGDFTWVDHGHGNFTAWAKNQPNNFKEEDCVHALGMKYNYKWNDVQCSDCHQFTCKKGKRTILSLNNFIMWKLRLSSGSTIWWRL